MALCRSYTLAALVAELHERTVAGEPQESLIGWFASLIKGLGIKMRTDKCTAPQFLDLPPKNRGRQVPVVIERGMLRVQFDTESRRIILSRGRRGGGSRLYAECNGAAIDVRTWTLFAVPPRASDPRPSKKEVDRAFAAPDADGVVKTGHLNVIQVIDGTVVTIYTWTHPRKGLVWCLASANGFDVSHLKWGGDETYVEVLFELLAKSPTFWRRPASDSDAASFVSMIFVSTFKHSSAGGAFAILTFIRWSPTLRGFGISSRLTWRLGSPRRLAFQASRVKQLTIVKISFV